MAGWAMGFLLASPERARPQASSRPALFDSDSVLPVTLSGNLKDLLNDRGEDPLDHPVLLSYTGENGQERTLAIEARTRGHFRKLKGNCRYPPILLKFTGGDSLNASLFREQRKLKLVMPCRGDDYVLREWLVYKIYNLVTPKSFRTRLVRLTLSDTKKNKTYSPFYAFFLEEEDQMAKRNKEIALTLKLQPQQTQQADFLKMAVFQYLIGNTDWSVQYLQNIKLIAADSLRLPSTVPYDFDHAGIVSAPYALPAEELKLHSVRERRYRGYCMTNLSPFDSVLALYNRLKPDIYRLYSNNSLLTAKYVRTTVKYLDDFYATINDPAKFKNEFSYPCDPNGTGNVIIKGLRKDD